MDNPFRDRARRLRRAASFTKDEERRTELHDGAAVFDRIGDACERGYEAGLRQAE